MPASGCEAAMEYALGAIVSVFILGYLVYALIRPEKF
jgi:K+-transporting ATPase KdpF subunit